MKRTLLVFICISFLSILPFASGELVLYLSFDNVDGDTVEDLSQFGNDGTLQNDPDVIDGQIGEALEFENSRVQVLSDDDSLSSEIFAEGNFTLVMWISAALAGNTWQQIFRAGPESNDTLFINNDGRLSWRGWVGAGWAGGMCETAPGVVDADTWTHAAVVGDTSNFRVYVDGEVSQESGFQETRGANLEYMIGGYSGGESYTGAVDEIAVFNEPLTDADIQSIVDIGVEGFLAVSPREKLATQWGRIKQSR